MNNNNSLQHVWTFLSGKKTYIIGLASAIYGWAINAGLVHHNPLIDYLLVGGGLASLRHAITTTSTPTEVLNPLPPPYTPDPVSTAAKVTAVALLAGSLLLFTSGCNGTFARNASTVEKATDITVASAMTAWGDYVAKYHPPVEQERKVKAVFDKYKEAMLASIDATCAIVTITDTNAIPGAMQRVNAAQTQAANVFAELVGLIQSFGVKIK